MFGKMVRRPGTGVLVLLLSAVVLISSGCGTTVSFTFTGKEYPPWEGTVLVFRDDAKGYYYEEIGLLSAKVGTVTFKEDVIELLKEKAAERGGNAIILLGLNRRWSGSSQSSRSGGDAFPTSGVPMDMRAVAIRIIQ